MKYINLPMLVIGLTAIVGLNLWAAHRDEQAFKYQCETYGRYCQ